PAAGPAAPLGSAARAQLQVGADTVTIEPEDVLVTQTPLAGWAVASDAGETVALEVSITPELRREGHAREFVRLVQEARKTDGLNITDRIALRWSTADPELDSALTEHQALISAEVLAAHFARTNPAAETDTLGRRHDRPEMGLTFWIRPISHRSLHFIQAARSPV
ncbi:MAG: DUF5915 domain-containing protein, partial [Streptosporangiaceae bacterium]